MVSISSSIVRNPPCLSHSSRTQAPIEGLPLESSFDPSSRTDVLELGRPGSPTKGALCPRSQHIAAHNSSFPPPLRMMNIWLFPRFIDSSTGGWAVPRPRRWCRAAPTEGATGKARYRLTPSAPLVTMIITHRSFLLNDQRESIDTVVPWRQGPGPRDQRHTTTPILRWRRRSKMV